MPTFQSTPFSGRVPYFLEEVLSSPAGSIPKGAQWMLQFEGLYTGKEKSTGGSIVPIQAIKKYGTNTQPGQWVIDECVDATVSDTFQTRKGCVFIQAVQMPGESTAIVPVGDQMNGYLRTYVGGGRDIYQTMKMEFLDTNISFVDNTIRAWVVATSRLGLIARTGEKNYRCNFSVWKLGVTSAEEPPTVTQKYTFFGACPVEVSSDEWNYSAGTSFVSRSVSFLYHYYTLDTFTENKLLQLHKSQAQGSSKAEEQAVQTQKNSVDTSKNNNTTNSVKNSLQTPPPGVSPMMWSSLDTAEQRNTVLESYNANASVYGADRAAENTNNMLKKIQEQQLAQVFSGDVTASNEPSKFEAPLRPPVGVSSELWTSLKNNEQRRTVLESYSVNANTYGENKAAENTNNMLKKIQEQAADK